MIISYTVIFLQFGSGGRESGADSHDPQNADVNNSSATMEHVTKVIEGTF